MEVALSPLRIGAVASNSTCARNTGGSLRESAVRFLRVPPLMQSVGAGVMGWVLEQGKCSQNLGQQAVVHRAARRTFESKCCRRSSAQLLRTPPPETHRASSSVPQMRRIHDVDVLGALSTHSTTASKIIWAAESKAPRPLEQHWARRVSEPVRGVNATHLRRRSVRHPGSNKFVSTTKKSAHDPVLCR